LKRQASDRARTSAAAQQLSARGQLPPIAAQMASSNDADAARAAAAAEMPETTWTLVANASCTQSIANGDLAWLSALYAGLHARSCPSHNSGPEYVQGGSTAHYDAYRARWKKKILGGETCTCSKVERAPLLKLEVVSASTELGQMLYQCTRMAAVLVDIVLDYISKPSVKVVNCRLWLNRPLLEHKVRYGMSFPEQELITSLVVNSNSRIPINMSLMKGVVPPPDVGGALQQPRGMSTKLHRFQLKTLRWMQAVEGRVDAGDGWTYRDKRLLKWRTHTDAHNAALKWQVEAAELERQERQQFYEQMHARQYNKKSADAAAAAQGGNKAVQLTSQERMTDPLLPLYENDIDVPVDGRVIYDADTHLTDLVVDPQLGIMYAPPNQHLINSQTHVLTAKGGILADEMGLGKTISMIGLIANSRRKYKSAVANRLFAKYLTSAAARRRQVNAARNGGNGDGDEDDEDDEDDENQPAGRGRGGSGNGGVRVKAVKRGAFDDDGDETVHALPVPDQCYYQSNATLVVCPSHLCNQWHAEVAKHTNPKLKCLLVRTKTDHVKLTYEDVIGADIIIISISFFANVNWYPSIGLADTASKSGAVAGINAVRERFLTLQTKLINLQRYGGDPFKMTTPLFEHFRFLRVVLDEAHELATPNYQTGGYGGHGRAPDMDGDVAYERTFEISESSALIAKQHACTCFTNAPMLPFSFLRHNNTTVHFFRSDYRWYVTGTPFPSGLLTLRGCLRFLETAIDGEEAFTSGLHKDALSSMCATQIAALVRNNLFCRSTKKSVECDYTIPNCVEETKMLTMSEVERGMYLSVPASDTMRLRQLCCHPQISDVDNEVLGSDAKTLDEIRELMIEQKQFELSEAKQALSGEKRMLKDWTRMFRRR
jgi:hypothetical protein